LQNRSPESIKNWMTWDHSAKKTETGEIPFQYTQLTPLKNQIPPEPPSELAIKNKKKVISVSREYDANINKMFYTAGHFELRHKWLEGVKAIDQVSHYLPIVGTKHRCVLENGQAFIYTTHFSYAPEKIVMVETEVNKRSSTYFIFEKINENRTRFTLDLYLKNNPVLRLIFSLAMKRKLESSFTKSLDNLEKLEKETEMPVDVD